MNDQLPGDVRPKWVRWLAIAVVALAVAVAIAVFIRQGGNEPPVAPEPGPSVTTAPGETTPVPSQYLPSPTATGTPTVETPSAAPTVTASIDKPVGTAKGVTARVSAIKSVDGEAQGPGEIAGPALRVTVQVRNETKKSIDLTNTVVNLYYGSKNLPATSLSGPDPAPFEGMLAAGKKASGSYIFNVPKDQRGRIRVEFRYSTEAAVAIFEGRA